MSSLTNEIDARPSDAIALAIRSNVPIYVEEAVLEAAGFVSSPEEGYQNEPEPPTYQDQRGENSSKEAKLSALQTKLREALEKEDYERAAKIRDEIKKLSSNN